MVHILEREVASGAGGDSRLSAEELDYAKEYADNMDTLMTSLALQHMPPNLKNVDRKKAG